MVAPLLSPGLPRRLLPFAVFLTAFSIVMMILFMSMDIKALKHREQFNFSQDLDFHTVAQDNPQFIAYIRAIHLQLPPVFRNTADNASHIMNALPQNKLVARLLGYKKGGVFVEAGAYQHGRPSDTEWLELALGWHGLLVQPDPRDFLVLQRQRRHKALSVHACLSPTSYPKEVTFRQVPSMDDQTVRAQATFTRVKCFPLFSLLLAANMTTADFLSLHAEGAEMQVL
ncbi:protein Star isoform X3 [Anabrus simplex]